MEVLVRNVMVTHIYASVVNHTEDKIAPAVSFFIYF